MLVWGRERKRGQGNSGVSGCDLRSADADVETQRIVPVVAKASGWMVVSRLLCGPPPSSRLPQVSRQLAAAQVLSGAVTCGSEHVFLLAYIKHLAVSSRRALKATVCSPKGEVTIQEPCFLKGFCSTLSLLGGCGEQRNCVKGVVGGAEDRILFLAA